MKSGIFNKLGYAIITHGVLKLTFLKGTPIHIFLVYPYPLPDIKSFGDTAKMTSREL